MVRRWLLIGYSPIHSLPRWVAPPNGRYDNESIAVTAIVTTFFLWTRALRTPGSWVLWSPLAALSYVYMVAAWGGYTFVLNMVGMHATALVRAALPPLSLPLSR